VVTVAAVDDDRDDHSGATDDDVVDTQWTSAALTAYRASAERLVQRLREHVHLTGQRQGRQRELAGYFASAEGLQQSVNGFAEAEFAWCGSSPVRTEESSEAVEEPEDGPVADPSLVEAPVVSVLGRWDYLVTDAAALLEHGRAAYLQAWPDDTDDDALVRVVDVEDAVLETLHGRQLPELEAAAGLEPLWSTVELVRHAGTSEDDFLADPFGVLGP
jgi:hypothetical protein